MRNTDFVNHPVARQMRDQIVKMPRWWKRIVLIIIDVASLLLAIWGSYALRLSDWSPVLTRERLALAFLAIAVAVPVFIRMGLYRSVIRYLPEAAIWTVLRAMVLSTLCWILIIFVMEMAGQGIVPRSVPFLYFVLGTLLIGSTRFVAKWLLSAGTGMRRDEEPVFVYGESAAAARLAHALGGHGNRFVMGIVDDDEVNHGRDVGGYRVFPPHELSKLVDKYGIREIVFSMSSISPDGRQKAIARVTELGIRARSVPDLGDIVDGRFIVNQIREIEIDELLGRSFVPPDERLLTGALTGKTVMVTGAGGSIGAELCRLIAKWRPLKLVLLEASEYALYRIEQELINAGMSSVVPILGSVTDRRLVQRVLRNHSIQVVYHAAAHKHVPLVEANLIEGIRNNVFGTLELTQAAAAENVSNFVLISSDKAVRPTNVMGATKRWAELIVRQSALQAQTTSAQQKFCAVRFGNVIGSNGSVVPLFKQQISNGGPLTVTDPDMTRYFMSIPEAAELIVQAGALSEGGDVFLLDMGEPVRIGDLAENMIRLAGFKVRNSGNPDSGIAIKVIGKRPGEKPFEELFYDRDNAKATAHPKIMRADSSSIIRPDLVSALASLRHAIEQEDEAEAKALLFKFIE